MDLPPEKHFHFRDGSAAKNLNELKDRLEQMSYEEFYEHVTDAKNDFANWIRYVLRDEQLADDLQLVKSIVETVEIINDYLYPGPAQEHIGSLDDIQSRIENEVFHIDRFDAPDGQPEESPDIEAAIAPAPMDEDVNIDEPTTEPVIKPREPPIDEKPKDDGKDEEISHHYKVEKAEKGELHEFHHDVGKLIVKDFIMGMIVGLIIGMILGKMLALF